MNSQLGGQGRVNRTTNGYEMMNLPNPGNLDERRRRQTGVTDGPNRGIYHSNYSYGREDGPREETLGKRDQNLKDKGADFNVEFIRMMQIPKNGQIVNPERLKQNLREKSRQEENQYSLGQPTKRMVQGTYKERETIPLSAPILHHPSKIRNGPPQPIEIEEDDSNFL